MAFFPFPLLFLQASIAALIVCGIAWSIALSGATGEVTGPLLHFEMARNGANIDPLALLSSH